MELYLCFSKYFMMIDYSLSIGNIVLKNTNTYK